MYSYSFCWHPFTFDCYQQVASTARMMVTRFGMSPKIGQVALAQDSGQPFLGRQMASRQSSMSSETKALIDSEVTRLTNEAYARAKQILVDNREAMNMLAKMLIEKETVTAEEFQEILNQCQVKVGEYGIYKE